MENPALTETTYYILLSLYHPRHGYGIMQETQQLSGGRVRLAAGTLYGALNALCEKGWISPLPMEKRKPQKRIPIDLRRAEGAQTGAGPAGGACCQWPRHFTGGTGMSETKTLHRNFWVWEFEKEERWLNEMAQEGWALQNAGFCTYTFEKTEPGQYIIRLAMLDSSPDFESFMEELEAQSVGHCFSWGYFRRSAQLGPFDMFSDADSRISHLNRIGQMVRLLCLANLLIGVTNTFSGASLAWLNLLCATFLAYGLGRISSKRESLVEERQLHE